MSFHYRKSLGLASLLLGCAAGPLPEYDVGSGIETLQAEPDSCHRARALHFSLLGSYRNGLFAESAAEIVAHDPRTQQLFVVNAAQARVDVLDIADPASPTLVTSLAFESYGAAVNSVAVHEGVAAMAVEAHVKTDPGTVVFVSTHDLAVLSAVTVGALPDMVTFTPNGRYVLTANEGEPNADYTIDPEGSVSVIDLKRGARRVTQANVRTVDFRAFNGKAPPGVRIFGPNATVAQDLEPEYLAVSSDSKTAWVTLQENNALARIDIRRSKIETLSSLGDKDHSRAGQGFDASDRDEAINIASWPVLGMYQPDAIAALSYRGDTYLVMANEGDARDYDGFGEETRIADVVLDPSAFPNAADLQTDAKLGRLKITQAQGDVDGDGDFDKLYAYGARSFSIRRADGTLLFDSGDELEQTTAAALPASFNTSNEDNDFDGRSDDKGPEPEGLAVGKIRGRSYAFIGLERVGGFMVYDVTHPKTPCFLDYVQNRNFTAAPETAEAGDLGPEGLKFVSASDSPTGEALLVVGNEVSGTTTLFEIEQK
jgi:hypothetical protein